MSLKQDLENRISVIQELEQQILQESVRYLRMKKLNELQSARENLRLQFYNNIQDSDILKILENEAQNYILFITGLTTKFGKSNTEFASHLQAILNICEQSEFFSTKKVVSTAKEALDYISLHTRGNKNIMTNYRLKIIHRAKTILNQYAKEKLKIEREV